MKFMYWPGSGALAVLSMSSIAMLYFYLGIPILLDIPLKKLFKSGTLKAIPTLRIVGAGLTGLALSIAVIGFLFKWQGYPGATMQLMLAVFGLSVITVISVLKWNKTKVEFYQRVLKRTVVASIVVLLLLGIPHHTWLNFQFPNNPELVSAILALEKDPDNEGLQADCDARWADYYDHTTTNP